jgi:hypothetical protein
MKMQRIPLNRLLGLAGDMVLEEINPQAGDDLT